ncbi:MAG TPA: hypothetical protein VGM88_29220 [Kofleriaceae bacterium]|jgi:serine/threonine-protein kinase
MRTGFAIIIIALAAACGGNGGGGGDDGGGGGDDDVHGAPGPYFTNPMFFNRDVSNTQPSDSSEAMIQSLEDAGGWGNGNVFQMDFSIPVLAADSSTPMKTFTPTDDFYTPDCDHVPMPIPDGGSVEGEDGYACTGGDDCHLLVFDADAHMLYEMFKTNIVGDDFEGGCLATWHTDFAYDNTLRGEQCTSADAAGFPMAPLLFTADEVAAGTIDHAIRFILPNDRIREGYTAPATHGTMTSGGSDAPAYGVHLRLRADYPVDTLPSEGAKVVARALQKYGMYHADGGNIALTGASDKFTTAKWDGLLDTHDLRDLQVSDFDVIDEGPMMPVTNDCVRTND